MGRRLRLVVIAFVLATGIGLLPHLGEPANAAPLCTWISRPPLIQPTFVCIPL